MASRPAKDAMFDGFAEVAKALGSGRRTELLDVLSQGERHVEALADEIQQSIANTSFHLRALATAGLVETRRDGNRILYRLASERVGDLWRALRDVAAERSANVESLIRDYVGNRDRLDHLTSDELLDRLRSGDVIVIDVRPEVEYLAGHITGARSVPADQLSRHIRTLPRDVEIVAYCRGPYCVMADEAVANLRRRGRRARRLEGGYPEWRHAQHPTSVGPLREAMGREDHQERSR